MTALTIAKLYKGAAKIDAATVKFHTSGQKLQAEAHKLACSVLLHVGEHKDIRVLAAFLQAAPEMMRTNGLRAWFEAHGPVKFILEGDKPHQTERILYVASKPTKVADAIAKPFWKFNANEGKPYEAIDVAKMLDDMVKKLVTDTAKAGTDHTALIKAIRDYKAGGKVDEPAAPAPVLMTTDPLAAAPLQ